MKKNGETELLALEQIDDVSTSLLKADPEVLLPATADMAALAIDWLGFKALVSDPAFRDRLHELPPPAPRENAAAYITRIWPLLSDDERGCALDMGLQQMVTMGRVADTGIRVRVWRAWLSGEWERSPSVPDSFSQWVHTIIDDPHEEWMSSEASYLYRTCEVVGWLQGNMSLVGVELPQDVESIFRRPLWRRWRTMVGKLWHLIQEFQTSDPPPPGQPDLVVESIREAVTTIAEAKDSVELQMAARQFTRNVPIILWCAPRDENSGLTLIHAELGQPQLGTLRQKIRGVGELRLEGETYDLQEYELIEYRRDSATDDEPFWAIRTWDQRENVWSSWELAEPPGDGLVFESYLGDPELSLEYIRYWRKKRDS